MAASRTGPARNGAPGTAWPQGTFSKMFSASLC
ncbi:hypothetical protein ADICEAN_01960 [Cesiribacter andamanensis AMV16]|uniref:Uncharacterized protein n=1 Tax=Cesiribacter andamanensis AMV16 TaxID=1279009 RepID=M7N6L5_9BACT|nr:hypothetical protein ADICEAN_01960 [Cesiribacter andamanensis AMV16]